MDIEFLSRRQAVMEWRDRCFSQAIKVCNSAAIEARSNFNDLLTSAKISETIWHRDEFVIRHIDTLMAGGLAGRLSAFLLEAADELQSIDDRFRPLSEGLAGSSTSLDMPGSRMSIVDMDMHQTKPASETVDGPTSQQTRVVKRLSELVSDLPLTREARNWSSGMSSSVAATAETLGKTLQDKTGSHQKLRHKALQRIATAWMGDTGTPLPVKAQLLALIDAVVSDTRKMSF